MNQTSDTIKTFNPFQPNKQITPTQYYHDHDHVAVEFPKSQHEQVTIEVHKHDKNVSHIERVGASSPTWQF